MWVRVVNSNFVVAIQALSQTIIHLTKSGRFRQAADREKEIGQIYLQETHDLRKACESYERAGEWYAQEDATAYVPVPYCVNSSHSCTERQTRATRTLRTCMPILKNTQLLSLVMSRLLTILLHPTSPSTVLKNIG